MSEQIALTNSSHQPTYSSVSRKVVSGLAAGLMLVLGQAANAQVHIGGSISGQVAPGVYGRVDIGSSPAPALIYPQPVIIAPPRVVVPADPVYMYVPPGHAKHWGKHCARYGACGQNVYFLRNPPPQFYAAPPAPRYRDRDHGRWERDDHRRDRDYYRERNRDRHWDRGNDDDQGRGHGRGHGKGHGRD